VGMLRRGLQSHEVDDVDDADSDVWKIPISCRV
jgi:hypothetical protein